MKGCAPCCSRGFAAASTRPAARFLLRSGGVATEAAYLKEPARRRSPSGGNRCRRKFLRFFPRGFRDETYLAWERNYKWDAHRRFADVLGPSAMRGLLREGRHAEAARLAVSIEGRTHLLFSFEKMALRDAIRSDGGAVIFAEALNDFLYGRGAPDRRFERWRDAVESLPRRQTRVLTWPVVTVFGFLAQPDTHFFFKPQVTRAAARAYGEELFYRSRPDWEVYASLLAFARRVRSDLRELAPRDMIDIQSFLWVQGSDEYAE